MPFSCWKSVTFHLDIVVPVYDAAIPGSHASLSFDFCGKLEITVAEDEIDVTDAAGVHSNASPCYENTGNLSTQRILETPNLDGYQLPICSSAKSQPQSLSSDARKPCAGL